MLQNLRNIAVVSLSTVGSRVLGLVRDILVFAALGAGLWNSAFILAQTLPNLFRRLLGEGALTSAVVPVFSDVMERDGQPAAFRFLNQVLVRLCLALLGLVTGGMLLLAWLGHSGWLNENWSLASKLAVVLLPYMLCICMAAIICAGLNLVGRFAVAASTPILLNLAMIGMVSIGMCWSDSTPVLVYWLCGGVLLGGLLQLLLPAWDLYRQGWRPSLRLVPATEMAELWSLFLPGLLGAAVLQLNILISRVLAYSLDESAASLLYLASRLMELPLGVFTIAVATVFFPLLAKAVSAKDETAFADSLLQGLRLVVAVGWPAGVGLIVLGHPILQVLFQWGAFDAVGVRATVPLIAIYGLGLPFYSIATFCTRGLHARKDMRTPVRVAGICLCVNAISAVILMQFFGVSGLALANVLAAVLQSVLLWRKLSGPLELLSLGRLRPAFGQILLAGLLMGIFCYLGVRLGALLDWSDKAQAILVVALLVPGGATLYFVLLKLLRFEELEQLVQLILKRRLR
ncbi:murein biosynthesis integral membrane protein MurJ [Coraliomargarita parva]|uniref:murein biosynthesis integral membrane protein MurJ n=1 Tax=Coraliomargarita parva TaxID=3014050 RepID=UPI0022B50290|nr:murein biosynthesis integral membrane protein MurJ [Coraliomargarita parva]